MIYYLCPDSRAGADPQKVRLSCKSWIGPVNGEGPFLCWGLIAIWRKQALGFTGDSVRKRICQQCRRPMFDLWVRKIPWRREWLTTPAFLPGESYGQRSLAGYSPQGRKESDTTEKLTLSLIFRHLTILSFPFQAGSA